MTLEVPVTVSLPDKNVRLNNVACISFVHGYMYSDFHVVYKGFLDGQMRRTCKIFVLGSDLL